MSKLVVFLCIALCASAANADYLRPALKRVHERILNGIDATIERVTARFEALQQQAQALVEKLINKGADISEKVREDIRKELQKLQDEIKKLTGRAKDVDVTECTKLAAHIDDLALAVLANMSVCVTDKLTTGSEYVEAIVKISNGVISSLRDIRQEALQCAANVNSIPSALTAIVCANKAGAKAAWVVAKVVPEMTVKITQLTVLLGTLPPSLAYCATKNGASAVSEKSSIILQQTRKCIEEKIRGAPTTTPKIVDITTEESTTVVDISTEEPTPETVSTTEEPTTVVDSSTEQPSTEIDPTTEEPTTVVDSSTDESTPEIDNATDETTPEIDAGEAESTTTTD